MAVRVDQSVFDGTTGRGDHGGRRTHIIRLLRDSKEPMTVDQVATRVDLPVNAARYYLESLVDSGLAVREAQIRTTPGRPKVTYKGTLPNQAHERAQGYRVLAEIMAAAVAQANGNAVEWMYQVGAEWGRRLMGRAPRAPMAETDIIDRVLDKLDALWFAPDLGEGQPPKLTLFNCPFIDSARRFPAAICQLHAGMINGALEEMRSGHRLVHLRAQTPGHKCEAEMARTTARLAKVSLDLGAKPRAAVKA